MGLVDRGVGGRVGGVGELLRVKIKERMSAGTSLLGVYLSNTDCNGQEAKLLQLRKSEDHSAAAHLTGPDRADDARGTQALRWRRVREAEEAELRISEFG